MIQSAFDIGQPKTCWAPHGFSNRSLTLKRSQGHRLPPPASMQSMNLGWSPDVFVLKWAVKGIHVVLKFLGVLFLPFTSQTKYPGTKGRMGHRKPSLNSIILALFDLVNLVNRHLVESSIFHPSNRKVSWQTKASPELTK